MLADELSRVGAHPVVAIGPQCASWKDLPRALGEASRTLLAQRRLGGTPVVGTFDQLGVVAMLLEGVSDDDLDSFCARLLGPLEEHDRTRDGDLLLSLRVYLDHNCSMRRSARELFVHVNTLRHRLDQIRALIRLDLDDPDVRIRLQLALRLRAAKAF
jgi:DNA-binding PucR family transcriptional regulator